MEAASASLPQARVSRLLSGRGRRGRGHLALHVTLDAPAVIELEPRECPVLVGGGADGVAR